MTGVIGDEPHYLIIAHSLLSDGDLRIENNHERSDFLSFYGGVLPMHYLQRGREGVIYSVHSPGLPAVLLPFYATGGAWGAMLAMALMTALAALAVFDVSRRVGGRGAALFACGAVTLTVPFVLQGWLIFPEMPAALLMASTVLWLWTPPPERDRVWVWRGLALSLLPWLHIKFSLLLAGAVASLVVHLWPRRRAVALLLTPVAVSGGLWLLSFYVMYGSFDPTVIYGFAPPADVSATFIPRGILGLFFDQEFGMLLYSPVYLMVVPGLAILVRRRETRWTTLALVAITALFLLGTARYYMWWGGASGPARFLVPVLPLAAPSIAVAFERMGTSWRVAAGALLATSLLVVGILVYEPDLGLMFDDGDGSSRLVERFQGGVALTAVLPSFMPPGWSTAQLPALAIWIVSALVATAGVAFTMRRADRWMGATGCVAFGFVLFGLCGVSLATFALTPAARETVSQTGRQHLLAGYDRSLVPVIQRSSVRTLPETELLKRATLVERVSVTRTDQGRVAGPFDLPPGRYEVRIWTKVAADDASLWIKFNEGPGILEQRVAGGENPVVMTLDLPVRLGYVWVGASDEATARKVTRVEVEPLVLIPQDARPDTPRVYAVSALERGAGRYLFFLDRYTYPEPGAFWVHGERAGRVLVSPGGAREIELFLGNGATPGQVTVSAPGVDETLSLGAWETRTVQVPLGGTELLIPVTIGADHGFRPREVDPTSADPRWLGVQVAVRPR